ALEDVNRVYIGFGQRGNNTAAGGLGTVYFDDIRLCLPRCIQPGPRGDLTDDCVVGFADLDIVACYWLGEGELKADLHPDGRIDFKDYAVLADSWLQDGRWP
ncbi:MAG TPA: hypothetical protein VMW16_16565, partial [Sedimentisphaerales bacterium]|nr:hypothetical protein [Sedimentisphaerales bacterium]